jgi:hypothetical protein
MPFLPGGVPPGMRPMGQSYQSQNALGEMPNGPRPAGSPMHHGGNVEDDPRFNNYEKIPAFYTVSINLGGVSGNAESGSVQLRPEPFVLKRITWATNGDCYPALAAAEAGYSVQGRSVSIQWEDEFTKFLGNNPVLISALFGDSNGFLDIPRGALFQGKQSLSCRLTRLVWPSDAEPILTRFDFCFQGLGLLPKGVAQSGSAG